MHVIVFDPVQRPSEDGVDGHLLYGDSKVFAALMQGVIDFVGFCRNGVPENDGDHYIVTTELHVVVMRRVETRVVLAVSFKRGEVGNRRGKNLFEKFYSQYVLLHGGFEMQQQQGFPLRDTLDDFVAAFTAAETTSQDLFAGIKYAPVERHAFLAVHALGMEIVSEYVSVKNFLILFNGLLVSTGLDPVVAAPLYHYLAVEGNGNVSNKKLTRPPYGRISTPAVLPGGGSSSFGRCIRLTGTKGFLFGTDDEGNSFCPLVYLAQEAYYLCAYLLDGLMFVFLLDSTNKPDNTLFTKLAHQLSSNLDIPRDVVPLLESDMKHAQADDNDPSVVPFEFTYRNPLNESVIGGDPKKMSHAKSKWAMIPFGGASKRLSAPDPVRESLKDRMHALMGSDDEVVEVSVKTGSNEGWMHASRGVTGREILIDMHKDPKVPLWKALEEIDTFTSSRFSTVFL